MEGSQPIAGKSILFLLVEGFEHESFDTLSCCLQEKGGNLLFASFNKGDTITSKDEKLKVESDVSFAEASEEYHKVVAVADSFTGPRTLVRAPRTLYNAVTKLQHRRNHRACPRKPVS